MKMLTFIELRIDYTSFTSFTKGLKENRRGLIEQNPISLMALASGHFYLLVSSGHHSPGAASARVCRGATVEGSRGFQPTVMVPAQPVSSRSDE
jgi:hypothetical protein